MRKITLLLIFSGVFIFTSCSTGVNFVQNHRGSNISYQLSVKDMKFIGEATAEVKGQSVFCLFKAYNPLMKRAMKKLNKKAGLKTGNTTLLNVRVDVENKFYFFLCTTHVTVSGDVYEITKEKQNNNSLR